MYTGTYPESPDGLWHVADAPVALDGAACASGQMDTRVRMSCLVPLRNIVKTEKFRSVSQILKT